MSVSPKVQVRSPITRAPMRMPAGARSSAKAKTPTLISWPPPPSPGSKMPAMTKTAPKAPPARDRLSTLELVDDDILEVRPSVPPLPPSEPLLLKKRKKRDALDTLREAVGELEYFATPWQAAGVCASALAKALGARAVLVHVHDDRSRELRIVAAEAKGPHDLLGSTESSDADFIAATVLTNKKPLAIQFEGQLPRVAPHRLRTVGASRSVLATPATWAGSCVALIEVIDATAPRSDEACAFVAERLAAFLGART